MNHDQSTGEAPHRLRDIVLLLSYRSDSNTNDVWAGEASNKEI